MLLVRGGVGKNAVQALQASKKRTKRPKPLRRKGFLLERCNAFRADGEKNQGALGVSCNAFGCQKMTKRKITTNKAGW